MYSWNDPKDRVAIVQLNNELRHAELELLSAQCATDRLRLRFSALNIARFAKRELLRKAVDLASSLHQYYSSIGKQIPTNEVSDETVLMPARPKANPPPLPLTTLAAGNRSDFGYSIITKAAPHVAWSVFTDHARWPTYSDIYGDIRWVEGGPWQVGSRMLIEVLRPVQVHVHHRITACIPPHRVGWIDHALGTTIEQWAYFEPLPDGGTQVRTWAEFTGMARVIGGRPLRQILLDFTASWYERFRADCDRVADESGMR
jgi:hypothetical protein